MGVKGERSASDARRRLCKWIPWAASLLVMGPVMLCVFEVMHWWQSMSVWCRLPKDAQGMNWKSTSGSPYSIRTEFFVAVPCGLVHQDGLFITNFMSKSDVFGVSSNSTYASSSNPRRELSQDDGLWAVTTSDDSPNIVSWKSQWERRNLSWASVEKEMVVLPDVVTKTTQELLDTRNVVYEGAGCGKSRSGPVMLQVQMEGVLYGAVPCPVFWECANREKAPRIAAVCWDSKFYDPPYPASLPTELGPGFTTPKVGQKKVELNYEFRGGVVFMSSVYTNFQSQVFDDKFLFLKGGCAEHSHDLYFRNVSVITRHRMLINMGHSLAYNQYHGLIELFARWIVMLPVMRALPNVPILITTRDAPFIGEMLNLIGITKGLDSFNVTYINRHDPRHPDRTKPELVYADILIQPQSPQCSTTSGAVWDHIRQHYFRIPYSTATPIEKDDHSWYLVISERSRSRGIQQHTELVAGLVSLLGSGKVKIFSDKVTWTKEEQRQLFSKAVIYIGGHGAGLSNMVFMPHHSSIIEIRPLGWSNRCFHYLADMLRFSYYRVDSPGVKASNLTIDVQEMLALVSNIIQAKGRYVPFYQPLNIPV